MNVQLLSLEERIKSGCSHVAVIDYTDLNGTAGTSKTLTPFSTGLARDIVSWAWFDLVTPFDGGSTSNLTIKFGYNGASVDDDDAFIDAQSIHLDSTEILAGAGKIDTSTVDGTYGSQEQAVIESLRARVNKYAAQETFSLEAVFTSSGANLSELTTGALRLYFNVIRPSELRGINGT